MTPVESSVPPIGRESLVPFPPPEAAPVWKDYAKTLDDLTGLVECEAIRVLRSVNAYRAAVKVSGFSAALGAMSQREDAEKAREHFNHVNIALGVLRDLVKRVGHASVTTAVIHGIPAAPIDHMRNVVMEARS